VIGLGREDVPAKAQGLGTKKNGTTKKKERRRERQDPTGERDKKNAESGDQVEEGSSGGN